LVGQIDARLYVRGLLGEGGLRMIRRIGIILAKIGLRQRGLTLCPLCEENIIVVRHERACSRCTHEAMWGDV